MSRPAYESDRPAPGDANVLSGVLGLRKPNPARELVAGDCPVCHAEQVCAKCARCEKHCICRR